MNYDELIKDYKTKTCILSVDRLGDDDFGNIRIVAGNKAHCDDIAALTGHPFEPGCPYDVCFPHDMNFENFTAKCAFGGEPLHTYINLYQMGLWLNMFMLPLDSQEENRGYCIYSYDVSPRADEGKMSDVSLDNASRVLQTCIKFRSSENFLETLDGVINDIREICESDRCCVLLLDHDEHSCQVIAESTREGSDCESVRGKFDDSYYNLAMNWLNILQGSSCFIIEHDKDMEELKNRDKAWYESLKSMGVNRLVLFPLRHGNELMGYIWAREFNSDNTIKIKETLELTTFFIASEMSNYLLMKRMEVLSSVDLLTGINNRNIMNNRIDRIVAGKEILAEPYAVIFADLNGLKRVNDTEGHTAGDEMIKDAANILQSVFEDGEVYRAGGDEFMILVCGITEEEVEKRMALVREKASATKNVSISAGVSMSSEEPDILKAMHNADARMYSDKESYYSAHPELKYR